MEPKLHNPEKVLKSLESTSSSSSSELNPRAVGQVQDLERYCHVQIWKKVNKTTDLMHTNMTPTRIMNISTTVLLMSIETVIIKFDSFDLKEGTVS